LIKEGQKGKRRAVGEKKSCLKGEGITGEQLGKSVDRQNGRLRTKRDFEGANTGGWGQVRRIQFKGDVRLNGKQNRASYLWWADKSKPIKRIGKSMGRGSASENSGRSLKFPGKIKQEKVVSFRIFRRVN